MSPKIRMWLESPSNSSFREEEVFEIPDAEWSAMTEGERQARLDEEYDVFLNNNVEGGAYVVTDDD